MSGRLWPMAALALILLWLAARPAAGQFAPVPPKRVEVTGPEGAPIDTSLSESSSAAVRMPVTCTAGKTRRIAIPQNTLTAIPPRFPDGGSETGIPRWNRLTLKNTDNAQSVVCQRGPTDAGSDPTCTAPGWGDTLYPDGDWIQYSSTEAETVVCTGCAGAGELEVMTEQCVP